MIIDNFDQFFHDNPIPMWVFDPQDYSIKEANQTMADVLGYSREELLSFTVLDLRPEEEVLKLKQYLSQTDNDRVDDEGVWKLQKKNGEYVYARVVRNPVRLNDDGRSFQLVMYKDITDELNSRLRHEMLFKHSLDGIMLTIPNGDILQANPAACKMLGMTEQELIEQGREGIVAKDEKLARALQQRSETGRFVGELNFIHKTGQKIPVELTTSLFKNFAGEKRTSLTFRDIRNRKKQEQALQNEKEFTEAVLNSLPGVFFVLDHEGHVVRFNENSKRVFGMPADDIKGRAAAEFVHESDKDKVPVEVRRILEGEHRTFELTLNTAGGNTAIYRFCADRLDQDGRPYIIGTGIDVTKKKELQDKLNSLLQEEHVQRVEAEADRDKLKEMFEETPSPKCVLEGPDLRYVIANKAHRQVVGQEDIIGKKVTDVAPEIKEQGYIDLLQKVYQTGEPYLGYSDPVEFNKKNEESKQKYIFNLLFAPLFDEDGDVYGIFIEAMDFSDQIAYQQQLKESLREKETLLAEIHHRVKNNLAIITGMMQLQAMETEDDNLQGALRSAQQRIQTIATIHELLYGSESLSHINFGENIEQLLNKIKEIFDPEEQVAVDMHVEQIPMNINQAIPCALVVNEVVTNAYKHAFTHEEKAQISVHLREVEGRVVVEITDNGVGIPDNFQENASSIGMTLINLLKQQLKGEIQFSSDNGTRFRLKFEKADVKGIGNTL